MLLKNIAIVYNPKGGSANKQTLEALSREFSSAGIQVQYLPTGPEPGSAMTLAGQAAVSGAELIVAFGGDGTACQVAEGLQDTQIPMAVYPGGTGNLFARSFYADPGPHRFARMILKGNPQAIDMIEATYQDSDGKPHQHLFMVGFGLGKLSDAISTASPFFKRLLGRLVYVIRVSLACLHPDSRSFEIETPDGTINETAAAVFAINVAPPVMATLSRGCNASDGLMDVVILRAQSLFQLYGAAIWLAFGAPERSKYYLRLRVSEVAVTCKKPMLPNIDGDPGALTQKIKLKVVPGAARMVLS